MKKHLKTPSNIKKNRRHGFLRKMRTAGGRKTISRRRAKGRKRICL